MVSKANDGRPIGLNETLISNERVVTVNATGQVTTITSRNRNNAQVKTETFFGAVPFATKDR